MVACQGSIIAELLQAAILAGDVLETFSNRHYFASNYTFLIICHKIGVAINKRKVAPFIAFSKLGETFSSFMKAIKKIL